MLISERGEIMTLIKTIKCLFCLVTCSKYLYYIKKILCVATVVVLAVALFSNMDKYKAMISKFKVM